MKLREHGTILGKVCNNSSFRVFRAIENNETYVRILEMAVVLLRVKRIDVDRGMIRHLLV